MRTRNLVVLLCLYILFSLPCSSNNEIDIPGFNYLTTDGKSFIEMPRAISSTGKIALMGQVSPKARQLVVMDLDTREEVLIDIPGYPSDAAWSPDGKTLAYTWRGVRTGSKQVNLCLWSLDKRTYTTLAEGTAGYGQLVWSPDGRYLAARKYNADPSHVTISIFDVAAPKEVEVNPSHIDSGNYNSAGSWSPNSKAFAFNAKATADSAYGLWICNADGTNLKCLTPEDCILYAGTKVDWQKKGRWIAFSAHYKRDAEEEWLTDIWLVRPSGENLQAVTNGAGENWQHRSSYGLYTCTPDERYAVARWYFPDPVRQNTRARGWAYVDMRNGQVIPAVATDISGNIRDTASPFWEMSPDGRRFFCHWAESDIQGLGSDEETRGTTWGLARVFDIKTRASKELLRFQADHSQMHFHGWPSFSPDGRRVYFTLRKEVSEENSEVNVCYIDLDADDR